MVAGEVARPGAAVDAVRHIHDAMEVLERNPNVPKERVDDVAIAATTPAITNHFNAVSLPIAYSMAGLVASVIGIGFMRVLARGTKLPMAVINTNLNSVFNVTRQVIDGMSERGWGRIINISSVNAIKGQFGQTNYSAAKAGIHGFTKALALEVARKGVTVNTISPGYIGTKMVTAIPKEILDSKILPQIPIGRLGKPDEVAGLIIYLCSEEAAFVTGANISINGGQHMY
mgnify:CR=1 FL=1